MYLSPVLHNNQKSAKLYNYGSVSLIDNLLVTIQSVSGFNFNL